EPDLGEALFHQWRIPMPDPGEQKVLPHREADIAVAQFVRDLGQPAHLLARELANGQRDTGPHLANLLLGMETDVGLAMLAVGPGDLLVMKPRQLGSELGLHLAQKLVETAGIEHILEAGPFSVGSVAPWAETQPPCGRPAPRRPRP